MYENNANFMDAVNIVALFIGILNMIQNQEQTAYNDVNAANEREARYLLDKIGKRLDFQDAMLKEILDYIKNDRG